MAGRKHPLPLTPSLGTQIARPTPLSVRLDYLSVEVGTIVAQTPPTKPFSNWKKNRIVTILLRSMVTMLLKSMETIRVETTLLKSIVPTECRVFFSKEWLLTMLFKKIVPIPLFFLCGGGRTALARVTLPRHVLPFRIPTDNPPSANGSR